MRRISCVVDDEMYADLVARSIDEGLSVADSKPVLAPILRKALRQYLSRYGKLQKGRGVV